jgi:hypothetical protein
VETRENRVRIRRKPRRVTLLYGRTEKGRLMASQLVTVVRPLTITTAGGNPFVLGAGQRATVDLLPFWPGQANLYRVSGSLHHAGDGRALRCFPGYEPTVRVDRLHRAVAHPEPLYRHCDRCHGSGQDIRRVRRSQYDWTDGEPVVPTCQPCEGTGHSRVYPAVTA